MSKPKYIFAVCKPTEDVPLAIAALPLEFWQQNHGLYHGSQPEMEHALDEAGEGIKTNFYEFMESFFEVVGEPDIELVKSTLEQHGFQYSQELQDFLDKQG